jgi:hypothetical protein
MPANSPARPDSPSRPDLEGLKVCPFCGVLGEVYKAFPMSATPWHVAFDHDDACPLRTWEGFTYATADDAVAEWNKRVPDPLIAHVNRLEKALKPLAEAKVANFVARGDNCHALGVTGLTLGHIREARATLSQGTSHE